MLHCPNCRAHNPGSIQCRRCGMDLDKLITIENSSKLLILGAIKLLTQEDLYKFEDARDLLLQACKLQHDPLSVFLLGFLKTL